MKKFLYLLSVLLLFCFSGEAAEKLNSQQKKARKIFAEAKMVSNEKEQISMLKEAIELDREYVEAYWQISALYKQLGDEVNSLAFLDRVAKPKFNQFERSSFLLGKASYEAGQYERALAAFKNAGARHQNWIKKCEVAIELKKRPVPFKPVNLVQVNTDYDDYWPSITADGRNLSLTVLVGEKEGIKTMFSSQEDIYQSELQKNGTWSRSVSIGTPINTDQNEGAQSFSADGRYMFFVACNRAGGTGSCDIYYSIREGNRWSAPINPGRPLNTQYWETAPSFSAAGDELFFSSARPRNTSASSNSNRDKDIWVSQVTILDDGKLKFSEPVNLGAPINTPEDEYSPFIHADNKTLYFSSTGHPGMGDYDIFYSRRDDSGRWGEVKNIGYPINTHRAESGFCVNAQGDKAYLSSNGILKNGRGKDVYEITLPEELRPGRMEFFDGKVIDAKTKKPVQARIEVFRLSDDKMMFQSISDKETGEFQAFLPIAEEYGYHISRKGYLFVSGTLEKRDELHNERKEKLMREIAVGEKLILNNVFFDFDKHTLKKESIGELKRLIRFMKQNSSVSIELAGHTDIIGSYEYNMKLSEARAKEVADYLIKGGILEHRLSYHGYGPDLPIDTNDTDEGRAQNRRTEIIITKFK
ncbi:MAG: OmpA family protein [Prevotellaceae bacterium]|jgi:outer membrane protein OmpA-like peptidoglycan-associated protein|nr:OmpA family protein [Prevotellaceae bacterium]